MTEFIIIFILFVVALIQSAIIKDLRWELEQDQILSEKAVKDLELYYEQELRNRDFVIGCLKGNVNEMS